MSFLTLRQQNELDKAQIWFKKADVPQVLRVFNIFDHKISFANAFLLLFLSKHICKLFDRVHE